MRVLGQDQVLAVRMRAYRSRWTPGHRGLPDRTYCRTVARCLAKVATYPQRQRRLLTLTYDGKAHVDEQGRVLTAERLFDLSRSKRHVGELVRKLRRRGYRVEYRKGVEFQQNGNVHYHLILLGSKRKIEKHLIQKLWGHGFIDIRACNTEGAKYTCKSFAYAAKGIDDEHLPEFMLLRSSATKLGSTSRGFYLDARPASRRDESGERQRRDIPTIGEVRAHPDRHVRIKLEMVLADGSLRVRTARQCEMVLAFKALVDAGFMCGHGDATREWWGSQEHGEGRKAAEAAAASRLDSTLLCGVEDLVRAIEQPPPVGAEV